MVLEVAQLDLLHQVRGSAMRPGDRLLPLQVGSLHRLLTAGCQCLSCSTACFSTLMASLMGVSGWQLQCYIRSATAVTPQQP